GSKATGGWPQILVAAPASPSGPHSSSTAEKNARSIASSTAVSGWRKSTVKRTSPGTTLGEFGLTSREPTVPTARGGHLRALAPANTPEEVIAGENRAPSSLVQFTTSIGANVS